MKSYKIQPKTKNPLGRRIQYPDQYNRELIFPIRRSENRLKLGLSKDLPFAGYDLWNLYEISWLQGQKSSVLKPEALVLQMLIPFDSENLLESKSVKLYFNSLNNEIFVHDKEVMDLIGKDLKRALCIPKNSNPLIIKKINEKQYAKRFPKNPKNVAGNLQSSLTREILRQGKIFPELIQVEKHKVRNRVFMTHLFRSLCPLTGQPDWGTVYIKYTGNLIAENTLFDYLLTFRNHPGFHEHCCEQIFCDLSLRAKPQSLYVSCHFTRRGGIDINPVRYSKGLEFKKPPFSGPYYRQ